MTSLQKSKHRRRRGPLKVRSAKRSEAPPRWVHQPHGKLPNEYQYIYSVLEQGKCTLNEALLILEWHTGSDESWLSDFRTVVKDQYAKQLIELGPDFIIESDVVQNVRSQMLDHMKALAPTHFPNCDVELHYIASAILEIVRDVHTEVYERWRLKRAAHVRLEFGRLKRRRLNADEREAKLKKLERRLESGSFNLSMNRSVNCQDEIKNETDEETQSVLQAASNTPLSQIAESEFQSVPQAASNASAHLDFEDEPQAVLQPVSKPSENFTVPTLLSGFKRNDPQPPSVWLTEDEFEGLNQKIADLRKYRFTADQHYEDIIGKKNEIITRLESKLEEMQRWQNSEMLKYKQVRMLKMRNEKLENTIQQLRDEIRANQDRAYDLNEERIIHDFDMATLGSALARSRDLTVGGPNMIIDKLTSPQLPRDVVERLVAIPKFRERWIPDDLETELLGL